MYTERQRIVEGRMSIGELRQLSIEKLRDIHMQGGVKDIERDHWVADEVLCDLLVALGYSDVVTEWEKVSKWYA
jgi:hypothetical protein